eukprot:scaffold35444_cov96-Isochrysis_galbana.AAC.1
MAIGEYGLEGVGKGVGGSRCLGFNPKAAQPPHPKIEEHSQAASLPHLPREGGIAMDEDGHRLP